MLLYETCQRRAAGGSIQRKLPIFGFKQPHISLTLLSTELYSNTSCEDLLCPIFDGVRHSSILACRGFHDDCYKSGMSTGFPDRKTHPQGASLQSQPLPRPRMSSVLDVRDMRQFGGAYSRCDLDHLN